MSVGRDGKGKYVEGTAVGEGVIGLNTVLGDFVVKKRAVESISGDFDLVLGRLVGNE